MRVFSRNVLGNLDTHMQNNGSGPLSYKIKLKWIRDLNLRLNFIKLLEENVEKKHLDNRIGNDCSDHDTKIHTKKQKKALHQV